MLPDFKTYFKEANQSRQHSIDEETNRKMEKMSPDIEIYK